MISRQILLATLLVGAAAFSSWYSVKSMLERIPATSTTQTPSSLASHILLEQFEKSGHLKYSGNAAEMTQLSDQSLQLTDLAGSYISTPENSWSIQANSGHINSDNTEINLKDQVILQQLKNQQMTQQLTTHLLTIYPQQNSAFTPEKVTFSQAGTGNITTATGLKATENPPYLELLSSVKSIYETSPLSDSTVRH